MCVILICKRNKPTVEILRKCHNRNDDGAGVAWFSQTGEKDGKPTYIANYKKGFTHADQVNDFIQKLPLPFIVHFRWASIGGKSLSLTHPFEITENSELKFENTAEKLLFQNGTIHNWDMYLAAAGLDTPTGFVSDSRALAMILAKHGNGKFLTKFPDSRFVMLNASDKKFYIYGKFDEENGIQYSNMSWKNAGSHSTHNCCNHSDYDEANDYMPSGNSTRNTTNTTPEKERKLITLPRPPENVPIKAEDTEINGIETLSKKQLKKLRKKALRKSRREAEKQAKAAAKNVEKLSSLTAPTPIDTPFYKETQGPKQVKYDVGNQRIYLGIRAPGLREDSERRMTAQEVARELGVGT